MKNEKSDRFTLNGGKRCGSAAVPDVVFMPRLKSDRGIVKVKPWQDVLQQRTITCKNTVIFLSSAPCKLNWASPLVFCLIRTCAMLPCEQWFLRSDATLFLFSLTFSVGRHKTVKRCRCFIMTIHTCGLGKSEAYIRTVQKDNGSADICRIVLKVSILKFKP